VTFSDVKDRSGSADSSGEEDSDDEDDANRSQQMAHDEVTLLFFSSLFPRCFVEIGRRGPVNVESARTTP